MSDKFGEPFVEGVKQGMTIGRLTAEIDRLRAILRELLEDRPYEQSPLGYMCIHCHQEWESYGHDAHFDDCPVLQARAVLGEEST